VVGAFGAQLGLEGTFWHQVIFLALLTGSQALLNHLGIRVTTLLTDLSGYLIFLVAIALTVAFLAMPRRSTSRGCGPSPTTAGRPVAMSGRSTAAC